MFFGKWQDSIKNDRAPTANENKEISDVKVYDEIITKNDEYGDFVGESISPLGMNDMQKDFLPWSKDKNPHCTRSVEIYFGVVVLPRDPDFIFEFLFTQSPANCRRKFTLA